jgi:tetratricopeptide (TPR) repeat protein
MAGLLDDLGRPQEALEVIHEALKREPHFVRARILEGSLLLRLGRRAEALVSFQALDQTLGILGTWPLDSGYARDLAADAPAERGRLAEALGAGARPGP